MSPNPNNDSGSKMALKQYEEEIELERFIKDELASGPIGETGCGLNSCKPSWLRWMANKFIYFPLHCLVGLQGGCIYSYNVATITTIEKRFKFSSSTIGYIQAGNDISGLLLAVVISYVADKGNRPRWIGIGVLFSALSCFVGMLPHLVYGPGEEAAEIAGHGYTEPLTSSSIFPVKKEELCHSPMDSSCSSDSSGYGNESYMFAAVLLFLSQFLSGVFPAIFYSVGITFFDDNFDKKTTPIFYAIYQMVRVLGPVVGFILGSRCLALWIDPSVTPDLNPKDPRWLGAWWLGYAVIGTALSVLGSLFFFFPPTFPEMMERKTQALSKEAKKRAHIEGGPVIDHAKAIIKEKNLKNEISLFGFMDSAKRLFKNKVFIGNVWNTIFFALGGTAYGTFAAKYKESQFALSASGATLIEGLAGLVSSVLGLGIGGLVLMFYKPSARAVLRYNVFITLWLTVGIFSFSQIGCSKVDIIGPGNEFSTSEGMSPSVNGLSGLVQNPSCSGGCDCSDRFEPVCGQDGQVYYSPCYAGCTDINATLDQKVYINCQCITNISRTHPDNKEEHAMDQEYGTAVKGYCPVDCYSLYIYIGAGIVTSMIMASGKVGSVLVFIRAVEERDKALALGLLTFFLAVFGFIPAPIIMGAVIDSTCLVWDWQCGKRGNCWFYDTDSFRLLLHVVPGIFIFISVFGDLLMLYYSKDIKMYGETDEEEQLNEKNYASELKPLKDGNIYT